MQVRCKFVCSEKTITKDYVGYKFHPVMPRHGEQNENSQFFKWTPSGEFQFNCLNPNVNFEIGKEYYFDISPAE